MIKAKVCFLYLIVLLCETAGIAQEVPTQIFQVILESLHYTQVYPEVFSRVVYLPKKLGESFQEGELLLKLDNDVYKANYMKAKKISEKAEADLHVKQELFQQQLLSVLELKESEAALASAHADVVMAEKSIAGSEIRAGYRGKIANVTIRLFELPERDKPMLAYLNDESIIAKFLLPSFLLKRVQIGERLYILIMDTEEIIPARIIHIGPDVNPTSGTVKIEAEFANPESRWKCGMTSFASFDLKALLAQNPLAVVLPEPEHERANPEQLEVK